ncbi:monovalent cation/H+ antiporter complex subunit F [Nocardioides sp. J54]|uniref:monovalent cation/H+ antiporter complex subunit F n=1 Tax=Nocardioides sp. J54 TaxID=935866 RepID=UPI00049116F6|nr:monovalent cation/H+ antiporter complex subunit F [Nocardioides sp. J54]
MSVTDWVLGGCVVVLAVAALLLTARITIGPTTLDRIIAMDALIAVLICGLALDAAVRRSTDTIPILLTLTVLGFVGSVSVARFTRGRTDIEGDPR